MAWQEKYGAIWSPPLDDGDHVLQERFLPRPDVVTLIVKRADGFFTVSVLKKANDPQWRLPFWSPTEVPALVETLADAEQYLAATMAILGEQD
ncbi:hypothetical protein [Dyella mobilis]|uniref:Uncharacterized protein n=1 Tax=Dyella mobilis TaxID=1849582 RepID=A0ABS2KE06_9GAMM|nr:hypothetical protein [Dyella mobilis]MBM7129377.1 hypothetical protein [Dyella mobilis]GLQ98672.1 hypothetical protein GCM10007863_30920 [Dyella mobilis]